MALIITGFLCGIVYAVGVVITFGATLAHFSRKYPSIAHESYRDNVMFAATMAVIPPAWLVCVVNTGFYRRGFLFGRPGAALSSPPHEDGRDETV